MGFVVLVLCSFAYASDLNLTDASWYWSLNDTNVTGNIAFDITNNIDYVGTKSAGAAFGGVGKIGEAIQLNGGHIDSNSTLGNIANGTLRFWFKATYSDSDYLYDCRDGGGGSGYMNWNGAGAMTINPASDVYIDGVNYGHTASVAGVLQSNTWHEILIRDFTCTFNAGDIHFGDRFSNDQSLSNGFLDEIGLYNGRIAISEINRSYNSGNGITPCFNCTFLFPNMTMSLTYPKNRTTYYGNYTGNITINLDKVNDTATCDINDSRWTLNTTTPLTTGSVVWLNNTPIIGSNQSILINCSDKETKTNMSFWFYLDTILDLYFYDEETNELLNGTLVYLDLISDDFAGNYSTNTSFINLSSLGAGDYTINYRADGYDVRNYYITLIEGQKNTANLYLLNSTKSTLIIPTVYNQNSDLTPNVTMKIQRYYVATNSYITVSMTKTNEEGEGVLYVELYDVNYKIIFEYQKEIILITDPYPFTNILPVYRINLVENAFESWVNYDNVITNVSFINATGTIYARFIYNDVTNNLREGCLKVTRYTTTSTDIICYNCTSSSAATLTCLIDDTLVGEYIAIGSFDTDTENSWYDVKMAFFNVVTGKYAFGDEGIFTAMIMIGTITLLGISTITGSFILLIVSFIFISVIGLIQGVTIGTAMSIVVMVFILLFIIRKVMEQ